MTRSDHRAILLCFSHLRWGFVWQRPQHLLSRAAREYRVIFFEELYQGPEVVTPYLFRPSPMDGVEVIVPHLPPGDDETETNRILQGLLETLLRDLCEAPTVLWYYTPAALAFTRSVEADLIVYDCMDQLTAFKGASPRLGALEQELFRTADLVTCGGRTLFEEKRRHHSNAHLFPSSIDAGHFRRARTLRAKLAPNPDPTIGFFGVIDERLDLELVAALARMRPSWTFEMIGPVAKIAPSSLPQAPNIVWSGQVDYAELPERLSRWDLGFMPFAMNAATAYISPTKTPEFLAAGLPVISTPVRDVVTPYGTAGLVEIADDAQAFALSAELLLQRPRDAWLAASDQFLSHTSWDRTYAGIRTLLRRYEPTTLAGPRGGGRWPAPVRRSDRSPDLRGACAYGDDGAVAESPGAAGLQFAPRC
jgi:glycosyltransferase involved in cell wall biosynthesis